MPSEGCLRCSTSGVTLMDGHLCGRCHTMLFTEQQELSGRAVLEKSDGSVVAVAAKLPSGRVVVETASGKGIDVCDDDDEFEESYSTDEHVIIYG